MHPPSAGAHGAPPGTLAAVRHRSTRALARITALVAAPLALATILAPPAHAAPPPAAPPPAAPQASERLAGIGDLGTGTAGTASVAALVSALDPDALVTVGDNVYEPATYDDVVGAYYHEWVGAYAGAHGAGAATNRFFPAVGNHDLYTWDGHDGVTDYLDFFTLPGAGMASGAPSGTERYYDVRWGPVHLFVLDGNPEDTPTSTQGQWLRAGLQGSDLPFQVVAVHQSPFSSSPYHGSTARLQWRFEQWGADLVLSGHDHDYERIERDDDHDGRPLTYTVNGLGGAGFYPFGTAAPVTGSRVRFAGAFGALTLDACATNVRVAFTTTGGSIVDRFAIGAEAHPAASPANAFTDVRTADDAAVSWLADPAHRYLPAPWRGTFRPAAAMTRGEAARWLYRLAGLPDVSALPPSPFTDLTPANADAVRWLTSDPDGAGPGEPGGTGVDADTFAPDHTLNRSTAARWLYHLAGAPDVSGIPDPGLSDVRAAAADAVRWLTDPCPNPQRATGTPDGTFGSSLGLTRGQFAGIVYRTYAR